MYLVGRIGPNFQIEPSLDFFLRNLIRNGIGGLDIQAGRQTEEK
jgi:hypothetical protein